MKLRYLIPLVLLCCCLLPACQQSEGKDSAPALAIVDMARVMRDSEPGKAGVQFLETMQAAMQKELDAIQQKLEKDSANEALQQELQQVLMTSQQRIQAEQQNVVTILYDTTQRVINNYREQQGLALILAAEAAAAYSTSADVTNAIIAALNKQNISFKPVTEAPAKPAAPEAASQPDNAASPDGKDENKAQTAPAKDKDKDKANSKADTPNKQKP